MENNRNLILAMVLSVAVLFGWEAFINGPRRAEEATRIEAEQARTRATQPQPGTTTPGAAPGSVATAPAAGAPVVELPREQALAQGARVPLRSGRLEGSINLRGGRIDDLKLLDYRETVDDTSPFIELLSPENTRDAYFAEFGFAPDATLGDVPGPNTVWQAAEGARLTATEPVVLTFTNDRGLTFERTIALDDAYMFTVADKVLNASGTTVAVRPYGRIARYGTPATQGIYVLHEGLIGSVGEYGLDEIDYDDVQEARETRANASSGWLGITDKYWATALIPEVAASGSVTAGGAGTFDAAYSYVRGPRPYYETSFVGDPVPIVAGGEAVVTSRLFAGAKKVEILDDYESKLNIAQFSNLIDWGWFWFLTKPMFTWLMNPLYLLVGNFGVAILLTTVVIKAFFFPLANKSYKSMANMKRVQPQLTEIREKYADDRQAQQKAMMELYKSEKINPAAGCLPILIQIPVFFALYKVLYVTIEMRHAPFFGWIQDLSAPDPTSIFNLFGLLPYDVPLFLLIGVWPLIMGLTMFVQMQMNPTPPDPTQAMIFKWMPVVFTFMLATFPAGLVIYWAWNNLLSIVQQGFIMKRQGAKIELWDNIKGMFSRKEKSSPAE